MKRLPLAMMMFGLFAYAAQGASIDGYHTFTSADGRTMQARITEYNRAKNELRIERPDGKTIWVSLAVFYECDHSYIREWIEADRLLSPNCLSVTLEKKTITGSNDRTLVYHEIKLRNHSGATLDGVNIEYRYFIKLTKLSGDEVEKPNRLVSGRLQVSHLEDGHSQVLKTGYAHEFEEFGPKHTGTFFDANGVSYQQEVPGKCIGRCEVEGLWIRIWGPSVDGQPTNRDICKPEDLSSMVEWDEKRTPLPDDFSFGNSFLPEKNIMSLEEVTERGKPKDEREQDDWIGQVNMQFLTQLSPAEARELVDGVRFFYMPEFDPDGSHASIMGLRCRLNKMLAESVYWYEIELAKYEGEGFCGVRQMLARIYACAEDPQLRNGAKAVAYAEIELGKDEDSYGLLDLMASAYAANGQFDLAVKHQRRAIRIYRRSRKSSDESKGDIVELKERLKLYESGKLYIETDVYRMQACAR